MNNRRSTTIAIIGVATLLILAGCSLQPEVDGTGGVRLSIAPASGIRGSAVVTEDQVLNGDDAAVRLYLRKGKQYYNFQAQSFQSDPLAGDTFISGGTAAKMRSGSTSLKSATRSTS